MAIYEYLTTFFRKESRADTQRMVERRYSNVYPRYKFKVETAQCPNPPGFRERFGKEYRVFKIRKKIGEK